MPGRRFVERWVGRWVRAFAPALLSLAAAAQDRPTGYADPALCAGCHVDIARSYARTGMSRSFRAAAAGGLPEFDGKTFRHDASRQFFTPYFNGGRYWLRRHEEAPDGSTRNVLETRVDYVFGSGNHARSYLSRASGGALIELPVSWYPENRGTWAMSPSFDRPDHAGFTRRITYRCFFCHNAYPAIAATEDPWDGGTAFPDKLPEGIDCQRCHGPGAAHAAAARRNAGTAEVRASIVNPARLEPRRQMEICLQCHLETTSGPLPPVEMRTGRGVFSYRPGEPLEDYILHFDHAPGSGHEDKFEIVSSAYRLRKSRCFTESRGALTCTACHDPHAPARGEEAARRYSAACLGCHRGAVAALVKANRHTAATDCTGCHMQKRRPSDVIHAMITDHYIARIPSAPVSPDREEHDGNTLPYAGEVSLYYPQALPRSPALEIDLAIAQVRHQSNFPAGIDRLSRAVEQYRPERSEPYFELADACWQAGRVSEALPLYREAVRREPKRWRHYTAFGIALAAAGRPSEALEALGKARALAPNEPTPLFATGDVLSAANRLREAEAVFREAVAKAPEMAEGYNNLGTTLMRAGDLPRAASALREAVRLRPENAATHANLAGLLARMGDREEAREHFEQALRIGPSVGEARVIFVRALAATGDAAKALERYEEALNVQRSEMLNNLGTASAALGDAAGALRCYRLAVGAAPGSFLANFNLGLTLREQNKREEARPYLEKAAQSPDPALSGEARRLLR